MQSATNPIKIILEILLLESYRYLYSIELKAMEFLGCVMPHSPN